MRRSAPQSGVGVLALTAPSAEQASQHAADDLVGYLTYGAFGRGLHDTISFTAARAGSAEQNIFQSTE